MLPWVEMNLDRDIHGPLEWGAGNLVIVVISLGF